MNADQIVWARAVAEESYDGQLIRDLCNALAGAWDEGFKQGGPMHDENYDDPGAHRRNPYQVQP